MLEVQRGVGMSPFNAAAAIAETKPEFGFSSTVLTKWLIDSG
jgi:hypothetical protein